MLTPSAIRKWYWVHKWTSLVCTLFCCCSASSACSGADGRFPPRVTDRSDEEQANHGWMTATGALVLVVGCGSDDSVPNEDGSGGLAENAVVVGTTIISGEQASTYLIEVNQ